MKKDGDSWNTNRMGLEQTLSDDNLKDLSTFLMDSYTGSLDTLRYAYASEAINELLARRSVSVKPVASFILVDGEYHQLAEEYAESPDAIKLYAAPPLQAVTVPDGWQLVPIEPTYQMSEAIGLPWEQPPFPLRWKRILEAAPKAGGNG